jgi:hypothetical protein
MFIQIYTQLSGSLDKVVAIHTGGKAFSLHFLAYRRDFQAKNTFSGTYKGCRGNHAGYLIAGIQRMSK